MEVQPSMSWPPARAVRSPSPGMPRRHRLGPSRSGAGWWWARPRANRGEGGEAVHRRSGRLLFRLIHEELSLSREQCSSPNVVKCRPSGQTHALAGTEIETCRAWFLAQLPTWPPGRAGARNTAPARSSVRRGDRRTHGRITQLARARHGDLSPRRPGSGTTVLEVMRATCASWRALGCVELVAGDCRAPSTPEGGPARDGQSAVPEYRDQLKPTPAPSARVGPRASPRASVVPSAGRRGVIVACRARGAGMLRPWFARSLV